MRGEAMTLVDTDMDRSKHIKTDRLFSEYPDLPSALTDGSRPRAEWRPAADVYRCEHGWLVKLDLAGVQKEDINIEVKGSRLTISGTRRDQRIYERQETYLMEIEYSHFERSVQLPEETTAAQLQTEYRDGMLLVHVTQGGATEQ